MPKNVKRISLEKLDGSPVNNYHPDDCGAVIGVMPSQFVSPKVTVNDSFGLGTYDKIGHIIIWHVPHKLNDGGVEISSSGTITPKWGDNKSVILYEPVNNSKLLSDFLGLFKGVIDVYAPESRSFVHEEIKEFMETYGCLVAQPKDRKNTSTINNYVGRRYETETVDMFLEHWTRCTEIIRIKEAGERSWVQELNYITKEISHANYFKAEFLDTPLDDLNPKKKPSEPDIINGLRVPSLRAVISLHLEEMLKGSLIRSYCDECGTMKLSNKERRKGMHNFCSKKCGNKYRVRRHRSKQ